MIDTYKINAKDLSHQFLQAVQLTFPNKDVQITIIESDATEYLQSIPANNKHLMDAIQRVEAKEGLITVEQCNLYN